MGMGKKLISMKIQALQIPISKTGIADMIYPLSKIFLGQHIRWRLSVVLGEFIVNRYPITGSKEYHWRGQGNSNAKHGNIITNGGLRGTVLELLFGTKHLIPAIQQLLVYHSCK